MNIQLQRAHWVRRNQILWDAPARWGTDAQYFLVYAPQAGLDLQDGRLLGSQLEYVRLSRVGETWPAEPPGNRAFPHLRDLPVLKLELTPRRMRRLLQGQLWVVAQNSSGYILEAAALQVPGVLDDLYARKAAALHLGLNLEETPVLRLWAPTAQRVSVLLFSQPRSEPAEHHLSMTLEPLSGTWQIALRPEWLGWYYLYEVEVYSPFSSRIAVFQVTDPYSVSLSANSRRSQLVDLNDPGCLPAGWPAERVRAMDDIVIYELHVRDFSAFDESVPAEERGTYLAFTHPEAHGMRHLRALAEAGLTHLHLLPVFDLATVNDWHSEWQQPDPLELAALPPDSARQAELVMQTRQADGFNWGYDPYHYNVPEGSYATNPDGEARVWQFRRMVQALHAIGLRVVMDVVYNHTFASGPDERSVLDKAVPGYYHRLDADGNLQTSTCCPNTATEHAMMEKLMLDSLCLWARAYHIDGFRFDLFGHHMLENLRHVRQALDELRLENDGVDGRQIYLYGEGWDFGEVANNARGRNAAQRNLSGTGIGSFNDRLRDAVRGGRPFSGFQDQGFVTGLFYESNATWQGFPDQQRQRLMQLSNWVRSGIAGGMADYRFADAEGRRLSMQQVDYDGNPTGYTAGPRENVVYVSAHDNETLFDAVQIKAADSTPLSERIRMHRLALAFVCFSQGVPFFQAGDDLLRSKSLDANSYDSGDWFNRLDFSGQTHNFGVGLPPNESMQRWPTLAPLLGNPALKPSPEQIQETAVYFRELLRIRRSTPLLRLNTARQVRRCLDFCDVPQQQPGILLMRLRSRPGICTDPQWTQVVIAFNVSPVSGYVTQPVLRRAALELHPVQRSSVDERLSLATFDPSKAEFFLPARTCVAWVQAA